MTKANNFKIDHSFNEAFNRNIMGNTKAIQCKTNCDLYGIDYCNAFI